MNDSTGYAVFFFAPALEALGEAIKPYLQDGPAGPHVPCREVDTGGAFIEMTLQGLTADRREVSLELMVPSAMVRMIVSARSDDSFGFYDRNRPLEVLLPASMKAASEPVAAMPGQVSEAAAPTAPDAPDATAASTAAPVKPAA